MTRACLLWVVLMAALGSALYVVESTQAQICTDYYRFGPIYSNLSPFADGCMEAYGEEQPSVREGMCTAADAAQDDLSGRSVVVVLDEPVGQPTDELAATAKEVPHDSAESQSPHCGAYEDYYGYDYYRHGCPNYAAPPVTAADNRTESANDVPANSSPNEYYLKYGYGRYVPSYDAATTVQDEPTQEIVEAAATVDSSDHAHVGQDGGDISEYSNPCLPQGDACHDEAQVQESGEPVTSVPSGTPEADDSNLYVRPYDAYHYAGHGCMPYGAECHHDYATEELARTQLAGERAVESDELAEVREFDYENAPYGHCESVSEQRVADTDAAASAELSEEEVEAVSAPACPEEAYESYSHRYRPAYHEAYDAYGYGCGHDAADHDEAPSCEEASVADDSSSSVAESGDESQEVSQPADAYEGYEAYRYGYDRGCHDEAPSCEEASVADDSSSSVANPSDESQEVAQPADDEAYHAYDYGYEYESACENAQNQVAPQSTPTQEPATSVAPDYDMYEGYEYDYYKPYDERPLEESPLEEGNVQPSAMPPSTATDPYDSYDVYDYDNAPMQSDVEPAPAATDAPSSGSEQTPDTDNSDIDHQYYGRYPYGYGYGHGYDYEYQKESGSDSPATQSDDEADDDVTMGLEVDFQQIADWGRQSLASFAGSRFVDALRTVVSDVRSRFVSLVDRVDLQQFQDDVSHALLVMIQQPSDLVVEPGDANVFLFEFEAGYYAGTDMPIALEETPWVFEDPMTGHDHDSANKAVAEGSESEVPVSVLSSIDRDTLLQWAGHAIDQAKTAWASLSPELERMAAETLARVSLVEDSSADQR